MATNEAEVSRMVAEVHRAAQERLSISAAYATFKAWESVNPVRPTTDADWFRSLVAAILVIRGLSRLLAMRYFNLARAIETSFALSDPTDPDGYGGTIPLGRLFDDFVSAMQEVIQDLDETVPSEASTDAPQQSDEDGARSGDVERDMVQLEDLLARALASLADDIDMDRVVQVEPADWEALEFQPDDDFLVEFEAAVDKQLQEYDKRLRIVETDENQDTDKLRDRIAKMSDNLSYLVAALSAQGALSGGREVITQAGSADGRRQAWYRVTDGDPCGFCAMLASRGADFRPYTSERAAGFAAHPECACEPQAIWVDDPHFTERDLWFQKGYGDAQKNPVGKRLSDDNVALNNFRRWLAQQKRDGLMPPAPLQTSTARDRDARIATSATDPPEGQNDPQPAGSEDRPSP